MNLIALLFPERVKKQEMIKVFDELVIGINLCRTSQDIQNLLIKMRIEFLPLSKADGFIERKDAFYDLISIQHKHILDNSFKTK